MTEEELRARLVAEAEQAINAMLAEKPADEAMTLSDIERLVLWMGQQVQANVLKELAQASQAAQNTEAPMCERCGSRMQRRGIRPRQVVSEVGEMTLERAYYVCPGCGACLFPLDKRWGLDASLYSPDLKRDLVWLSGLLPYAQAEAVMQRIGKRTLSDSSLWRTVERQGDRLAAEAKPTAAGAAPVKSDPLWAWGKMLSMDGGRVNIRQEGWKELKVGLVGDVVSADPPDSAVIPEVHTVPLTYTAVLGDVEAFTPVLVSAAQAYGFFEAEQSSIPADGASWIWGIADRHFPQSTQIVDCYHARQHLADAAQARFPDQPELAAAWFQAQSERLFEGQLDHLLVELNEAGLAEFAHYFQTHQTRMRYLDFQEAGLPIGSGSVESEVKQFKQRLAGPGMRWSRLGAQRTIAIRAAVLDNSFDSRWANAA